MAYSTRFLAADRLAAAFEGGRVDHAADRGGDTAWGISRAAHPHEEPWPPSPERAKLLRWRGYWMPAYCDDLPELVALVVYDWSLTSGIDNPAKALQGALGVKVDGAIGPKTIAVAAAHCATPEADQALARWLIRGRANQLTGLVRSGAATTHGTDPATFLGGWWDRTLRLLEAVDDACEEGGIIGHYGPVTGGE